MECTSVPVPLDWDAPNGPRIALSVIRRLASRPDQRIGSLFVNPGGPGDSGVGYVAERGLALDALTQGRFDIVGWDIRGGAGGSAPVTCFADAGERAAFWEGLPVPTTRAEERRYLAKTIELAQRCGERNGELLAHISTADTARDLDHLRRLVGDRRLTYFGESYGTLIGQTYANLFPHRVRAMALDGVVHPVAVAAAPRRSWPAAWSTATGSSGGSWRSARRPGRRVRAGRPGPGRAAGRAAAGAAAPCSDPSPLGHTARGADLRRGLDRPQVRGSTKAGAVAPGRRPVRGGHPR